jgi:hypothetical protein
VNSCVLAVGQPGPKPSSLVTKVMWTTDGGASWRLQVLGGGLIPEALACGSAEACVLLGVSESSLQGFVTTDAGTKWQQPLGLPGVGGPASVWCGTHGLCLAGWSLIGRGALSVSTDGGLRWHQPVVPGEAESDELDFDGTFCDQRAPRVTCFASGSVASPEGAVGEVVEASGNLDGRWHIALKMPGSFVSGVSGSCGPRTRRQCILALDAPGILYSSTRSGTKWRRLAALPRSDQPATDLSCDRSPGGSCWMTTGLFGDRGPYLILRRG